MSCLIELQMDDFDIVPRLSCRKRRQVHPSFSTVLSHLVPPSFFYPPKKLTGKLTHFHLFRWKLCLSGEKELRECERTEMWEEPVGAVTCQ